MSYEYIIGFVVGCVIQAAVSAIMRIIYSGSGTLLIDRSDTEKDVYRLEIDDLDNLAKKKRLDLKIDANANLSQK